MYRDFAKKCERTIQLAKASPSRDEILPEMEDILAQLKAL